MENIIDRIFRETMKGDTSFHDNSPSSLIEMLFGVTYTNIDMRGVWDRGIKHGIEIGLNNACIEGQIIQLNDNTTSEKDKEFLEKFYKLADEYNCAIQYSYEKGMIVINKNDNGN